MADGMGAGDIFRSRILGAGLEDTPYPQQQIQGMMGGMQPQQLMAFFQNPQVQQQFKQFGIDPMAMMQGVRQSPFFPNSFMQQHPMLGRGLSGMMANVAATPEAPLVSGFGSGMSRAMQGMMGGPEMQRHYQLQQMMAPMGAMGAMMPAFGEQRRKAIEEAIVAQEQRRPQEQQEQFQNKLQLEQMRDASRDQHIQATRPYTDPAGRTWLYNEPTQQQPPVQGTQQGMPGSMPTQGMVAPGMPAQPGGFRPSDESATPGQIQKTTDAKRPTSEKTLDLAKAGEARARAALGLAEAANVKQQKGRSGTGMPPQQRADQNKEAAIQKDEEAALKEVTAILNGTGSDQEKQSQVKIWKDWLESRKMDIERNYASQIGHGGGTLVNPGASPSASPTDIPKNRSKQNAGGGGNAPKPAHWDPARNMYVDPQGNPIAPTAAPAPR